MVINVLSKSLKKFNIVVLWYLIYFHYVIICASVYGFES